MERDFPLGSSCTDFTARLDGILSEMAEGWKPAKGKRGKGGYVGTPKGKAKSVAMTEEGAKKAQELFQEMFGTKAEDTA